MRSRLTPDALLLGALLVVTLGIAIFAVRSGRNREEEEEFPARRTTYSAAPGGYQALYEALRALDYPVRRWRYSLDALKDRGVLIVAGPETPLTPPERRGLAGWVREGNLLIYLTDRPDTSEGLAGLAAMLEAPLQSSRPVQPTPIAAIAPELRTRAAFHLGNEEGKRGRGEEGRAGLSSSPLLLFSSSPLQPLYRDDRGTTVAYTHWGRGAAVLCSSAWSLSTAGVGQGDNFAWLIATILAYGPRSGVGSSVSGVGTGRPQYPTRNTQHPTPIWFDEYHHGYGQARGILALLAPMARLGLAQLVVAWLLLTYTVSRRFGGRVADESRVRRSRSEYLGSMASLLRRARAVDLAVGQVRRQFLADATRALGLPRDASQPVLLAAATTRGVDAEQLRSLLERADHLARERDRTHQEEALAVARQLVRVRQQLSGQWPAVSDHHRPAATDHRPLTTDHSND